MLMQAIEVPAPGAPFELVSPPLLEPAADEILLRIEACGICLGDALALEGTYPGPTYPVIPGHEMIGPIVETGSLASMVPPSWRDPSLFSKLEEATFSEGPSFMSQIIRHTPTLLVVNYDSRKRAPASAGDILGFISLGCVLQTMWLVWESLASASRS